MTSSDGLDLKCTIDTELSWKMVAKGSRSSTRRNKNSVVTASNIEAEDKSSIGTVAGESEPEKLSVSVLGQHFAERVEHVPIKKRRFMVRSSAQREGSQHRTQIDHTLLLSRLNPNLIDGRTSDMCDEMPDCNGHDFSGIEILAAAACSSDMSNDLAPTVDLPAKESVLKQQDTSTLSTHVEGNDSSAGTVDVSQNCTTVDSSDQAEQEKSDIVALQKASVETLCNDLAVEKIVEHRRVSSGGMIAAKKNSIALSDESSTERPKANMEASENENENLAPDSGAVMGLEKSSADGSTDKNNEGLRDFRLHWDLNVTMDAWGQPCDVEDEASRRDLEGVITESVASEANEPIDRSGNKEPMTGPIASVGHASLSSPSGPNAEGVARNGKEGQSGYDSQFEDGELREPYPWEEYEGDTGEIEQVDYGSEPEDQRFYSMVESNDNKTEDSEKGTLAEMKFGPVKCESGDAPRLGEACDGSDIEKHVVVCMNDLHQKKGSSSPSRSYMSKPFKEFSSHDSIQRRRPDNYEELSTDQDKFVGRDDRSGMHMRNRSSGRGYYSGWDSKRHFSPPNYKGGSNGYGHPRPKTMVDDRGMMNDFDQSGSGADGHVRRQFSNGGYRGRFRRFADGGEGGSNGYGHPRPKSMVDDRGMMNDFDQSGSGPDGHVRRQFSNGGYRGRFRRFADGGDRDFRSPQSDSNQFPGRMHNRISGNRRERGNSPVFRRLHYPQSESRSRSRSPVSWNGRNRSSPPPGGFRVDETMMERVRLPFQKRFPADQEMGFMSPPTNRMSSPRFFDGRNKNAGDSNNSFRGRQFRPGQRFDVGNSMRRFNSAENNNNNNHFRPFIRHRRFEGGEENSGGNRFEMVQQRTRRSNTADDGSDEIRRFRFNGEQPLVVTNNDNKES